MTRQCAWCASYLDLVESETCVTHGICESCVERIRHSILEPLASTSDEMVFTEAHARPDLASSHHAR